MEQDQATPSADKSVVSTRVMEVVTATLFMVVGALVIWDSVRLGYQWGPSGPEAGYFPFYIGCFLVFAGFLTNVAALVTKANKAAGDVPFVTYRQLKSVLLVFLPTLGFVALMQFIGLYSAAAIYISAFMIINGKYPVIKTIPYAVIVPILIFVMFEIWFLVPLPKGPIETMMGF